MRGLDKTENMKVRGLKLSVNILIRCLLTDVPTCLFLLMVPWRTTSVCRSVDSSLCVA